MINIPSLHHQHCCSSVHEMHCSYLPRCHLCRCYLPRSYLPKLPWQQIWNPPLPPSRGIGTAGLWEQHIWMLFDHPSSKIYCQSLIGTEPKSCKSLPNNIMAVFHQGVCCSSRRQLTMTLWTINAGLTNGLHTRNIKKLNKRMSTLLYAF